MDTTRQEIIRTARDLIGEYSTLATRDDDETLCDAIIALHMHGVADDSTGHVDALGHFIRVGRYIVHTDSQGFHHLQSYTNAKLADLVMDEESDHYSEYLFMDEESDHYSEYCDDV